MPTNQHLVARLSNQQLLDMANYYAGECLCSMRESCPVCSRGYLERTLEQHAKLAALEVLDLRGVPVFEDFEGIGYRRKVYVIKESVNSALANPPLHYARTYEAPTCGHNGGFTTTKAANVTCPGCLKRLSEK